jgi:gliding motility-associated-like protein
MRKLFKILFLVVLVNFSSSLAYSSNTFGENKLIKTIASPSGQISGNATVCLNATPVPLVKFEVIDDNGKAPYTFTYTINGGAPINVTTTSTNKSITVSQPTNVAGTFTYVLTGVKDKDNNTVTVSSSNTVTINVIPNYTVSAGNDIFICRGNIINLSATPTGNGSNSVSYSWTGPSGFTSNQQSPSIPNSTTAMSGNYTVTANIGNCKVQDVVNVTVAEPQLTGGQLIGNQFAVCLTDNTTSGDIGFTIDIPSYSLLIATYSIDWDNNGTFDVTYNSSNWSNFILHNFSIGTSTFSVKMALTSGCSVIKQFSVFVGSSPSPATMALFINQATGCLPHTTQYTFNVPSSNVAGTTYVVSWGDGTPDETYIHPVSIPTLTHIYKVPSCGHNVVLNNVTYYNVFQPTVVTQNPCSNPQPSGSGLISVSKGPNASFTPGNNDTSPIKGCTNQALQLNNTSDFGLTIPVANGATCSSNSPFYWTITPSTAGLWTAAGLGSNNGQTNQLLWTSGSMTPSIQFNQAGNYSITLNIKNSCGESSVSQTFCIESPPAPAFTLDNNLGCTPLAVSATNNTITTNCSPTTYDWSVAFTPSICGTSIATIPSQTTTNASFNFTESGTYTITLTATNSCGSFTSSKTVTVKKPPIVSINPIASLCQTMPNTTISPTTISTPTNCGTQALTYLWSFPGGSPATSPLAVPGAISYATSGTFTVSLSVTNECGTTVAGNQTFTINPSPSISGTSFSCVGFTSQLTGSATAATINPWTSSTPLVATVNSTGLVTGVSGGTTIITYTNSNNCKTEQLFTVNPAPTITPLASSTVCIGGTPAVLSFIISGATGTPTYQWYSNINTTGSGGTVIPGQTSTTFDPPASVAGTFYFYCIITLPSGGCSSIKTNTATVVITPLLTISTQPITTQNLCVGGTIPSPLSVTATGGTGTLTYQWYSNTTNSMIGAISVGTNSATYTPPTFSAAGTFYYYVVVSASGSGCGTATSTFSEVVVLADPSISVQPLVTQTQCQNSAATPLTLTAIDGIGTFSYQWYKTSTPTNTGGILVGINAPSYTPLTDVVGTFYYYCLVSQTGLGCSVKSNTATVVVVTAPQITTHPQSAAVCEGTPITPLTVAFSNGTGTATYQWYDNIGLIAGATANTYTPTNTVTTSYYCIITFSSGGCSSITSNTAIITINPQPTISIQPLATQTICVGGTISSPIAVTPLGGTGSPSYQWYTTTNNSATGGTPVGTNLPTYTPPTLTIAQTYNYYVIITYSAGGCSSVTSNLAQIVVVNDPTVTTQPLPSQTVCQTATPSSLVVSVSGGISAAYSYQWYSNISNNNTSGTAISAATNDTYLPPTANVGTTYYYCIITQTSGSGCNVSSATAAVVVTLAPSFTSQPLSSTICLGGTPTVLSVAYANGVGTPAYQWFSNTTNSTSGAMAISGETNVTFSPPNFLVGTVYYYCVISLPPTGGCSSITSDFALVTINAGATIDSQPTVTQSLCVGATLATPLSISYSGGTGTATYQWYSNSSSANSGGTLIPGATNANYTPSVFTTTGVFYYYSVVTLSGNGCGPVTSNVAEVVIVADPVVSSQPLTSQTICQNVVPTSLSVAVSGGISALYSYQWFSNTSNNNTSGTPISGALTDTYTPPTSNVGTLYYYCVVSQTSGSGCAVSSTTAAIVVNLAPTFTSQPVSSTICMGQTPTLLGVTYNNGVGTPQYQWYSNNTNATLGSSPISGATNATYSPPNSTAGTVYYYSIITLPTGGCSSLTSAIASVTINLNPVISNKTALICSDNPFTIAPINSGSEIVPAATTYTWSNPTISPSGSITGASAQSTPQTSISQNLINTTTSPATLSYTVTPLSGVCTGVNFSIVVTVNPAISPNVTSTNSLCFGSNTGAIQTNIAGGIPFSSGAAYLISWTGPNGFTSSAPNISNLAPGDYNLSIADAGGCPIANRYTITEPNDIVITTDLEKDISCFNAANGEIKITISGGTLNYNIVWTKNGTAFATTEDLSNLSPGTYVVTVSDANNCGPKTASFTITEPPILAVSLSNKTDVLCFGQATGAINTTIVGGTVPYSYAWSGPNGFTNSNQNLTALFAGTYNLIVTDNSGCAKNLSVQITQTPEIKITATTTPIICYGANNASISIVVSGGVAPYQILWSNLGSGTFQDNLSAGDYLITVTDALNCVQTLNVNIPEAPIFTINPVVKNISCFGDKNGSINLNIVGGIAPVTLAWEDSAVAGNVRNNLGPGSYTVTITDGKPCTIVRTFIILEPQLLVLSANLTNAFDCANANSGAINLLVSGGSAPFTYTWSNGSTTEDLTNIPAGNYLVTVKDANGCSKQAQYSINRPPPIVTSVETKTDFNCDTKTVKQTFVAQVSGGVPPYQLVWSSGTVSGANNELMNTSQNGTVILNATDAIGCKSSYTFTVAIPTLGTPSYNSSSYAYSTYGTYSINDPIQFTNTATGDYISMIWDFGDGSVSTDLNPVHTYINPKEYVVTQTVSYPFGCVYVQKITFVVGKGYLLVVPTAFTPNNDSLNDTFRPVTKGLKNVRLDIYDTWGSMIYSESGDIIRGWDGKIKGVNSENGNYYCKVSGETFYGIIINDNTPFVLIK